MSAIDLSKLVKANQAPPDRVVVHAEMDPSALGRNENCIELRVTGPEQHGQRCMMAFLTLLLVKAKQTWGDNFVDDLLRSVELTTQAPEQTPTLEE